MSEPARALASLLLDLESLVRRLTTREYATALDPERSGSVGSHVRHCLDHVRALEEAIASGEICYDHRSRGTAVERDPMAGVQELKAAADRVLRLREDTLDRPLRFRGALDEHGAAIAGLSSVGRELAFVVSHTIHHAATIGVLVSHRVELPDRFGYAPTTPRESGETACAP